jgi:hypothetical protein
MKLRRMMSMAKGYFESISEVIPDGSKLVKAEGVYFHLSRDMDYDYRPYRNLIEKCQPHQKTPIILCFDGASLKNPGPSGCGFFFSLEDSTVLESFSVNLYEDTNNGAEYRGLVYGLYCARLAGNPN